MKSDTRWTPRRVGIGMGLIAWLLAQAAGADGFRNPPDGAWALGRIGGRIVDIDDPSAVSHNPANLAGIENWTVMPSLTLGYNQKKFTDATGESTKSKDPWRMLPSIYAAGSVWSNRCSLGVGVNVPYGQATRWDKDSLFRYSAPYYTSLKVIDISPAVGFQLTDFLALGAALNLYTSDLDFKQMMPWRQMTGRPQDPDGKMMFKGDGTAVGGTFGMTVKLPARQRLALTYQLPFDVDYDGDFDVDNIPAGVPAAPASDFNTTFKYPSVVGMGYSINLTDTVRVEANVEWLEHSRNSNLALDIGQNNPLLLAVLGTNSIPQDWKDTWTFGLGGDWRFAPNWQLRAGYLYMPTPVPEKTLMPAAAEEDQSVVSLGLGYRQRHHAVDLALAQGLFNGRQVEGNQTPYYNGDYDFQSTLMAVSYSFVF